MCLRKKVGSMQTCKWQLLGPVSRKSNGSLSQDPQAHRYRVFSFHSPKTMSGVLSQGNWDLRRPKRKDRSPGGLPSPHPLSLIHLETPVVFMIQQVGQAYGAESSMKYPGFGLHFLVHWEYLDVPGPSSSSVLARKGCTWYR